MGLLLVAGIAIASELGVQLAAVAESYLRFRLQVRLEDARRATLVAITGSLPAGSHPGDIYYDSSCLRLTVLQPLSRAGDQG